ncbi:hypothetical protein BJ742DRAFT_846771 [Cladochytrium replicatum]|nr:hypothetical protein BJ742DRAFT_846771 [Cladochytrium replicatum]
MTQLPDCPPADSKVEDLRRFAKRYLADALLDLSTSPSRSKKDLHADISRAHRWLARSSDHAAAWSFPYTILNASSPSASPTHSSTSHETPSTVNHESCTAVVIDALNIGDAGPQLLGVVLRVVNELVSRHDVVILVVGDPAVKAWLEKAPVSAVEDDVRKVFFLYESNNLSKDLVSVSAIQSLALKSAFAKAAIITGTNVIEKTIKHHLSRTHPAIEVDFHVLDPGSHTDAFLEKLINTLCCTNISSTTSNGTKQPQPKGPPADLPPRRLSVLKNDSSLPSQRCRYKDHCTHIPDCSFSHTDVEIRYVTNLRDRLKSGGADKLSIIRAIASRRTQPCKFEKSCKRRDTCGFAHGVEEHWCGKCKEYGHFQASSCFETSSSHSEEEQEESGTYDTYDDEYGTNDGDADEDWGENPAPTSKSVHETKDSAVDVYRAQGPSTSYGAKVAVSSSSSVAAVASSDSSVVGATSSPSTSTAAPAQGMWPSLMKAIHETANNGSFNAEAVLMALVRDGLASGQDASNLNLGVLQNGTAGIDQNDKRMGTNLSNASGRPSSAPSVSSPRYAQPATPVAAKAAERPTAVRSNSSGPVPAPKQPTDDGLYHHPNKSRSSSHPRPGVSPVRTVQKDIPVSPTATSSKPNNHVDLYAFIDAFTTTPSLDGSTTCSRVQDALLQLTSAKSPSYRIQGIWKYLIEDARIKVFIDKNANVNDYDLGASQSDVVDAERICGLLKRELRAVAEEIMAENGSEDPRVSRVIVSSGGCDRIFRIVEEIKKDFPDVNIELWWGPPTTTTTLTNPVHLRYWTRPQTSTTQPSPAGGGRPGTSTTRCIFKDHCSKVPNCTFYHPPDELEHLTELRKKLFDRGMTERTVAAAITFRRAKECKFGSRCTDEGCGFAHTVAERWCAHCKQYGHFLTDCDD